MLSRARSSAGTLSNSAGTPGEGGAPVLARSCARCIASSVSNCPARFASCFAVIALPGLAPTRVDSTRSANRCSRKNGSHNCISAPRGSAASSRVTPSKYRSIASSNRDTPSSTRGSYAPTNCALQPPKQQIPAATTTHCTTTTTRRINAPPTKPRPCKSITRILPPLPHRTRFSHTQPASEPYHNTKLPLPTIRPVTMQLRTTMADIAQNRTSPMSLTPHHTRLEQVPRESRRA